MDTQNDGPYFKNQVHFSQNPSAVSSRECTPLKIKGWNPPKWRWMEDYFQKVENNSYREQRKLNILVNQTQKRNIRTHPENKAFLILGEKYQKINKNESHSHKQI